MPCIRAARMHSDAGVPGHFEANDAVQAVRAVCRRGVRVRNSASLSDMGALYPLYLLALAYDSIDVSPCPILIENKPAGFMQTMRAPGDLVTRHEFDFGNHEVGS